LVWKLLILSAASSPPALALTHVIGKLQRSMRD
jgi:hypothetical protein